MGGFPARDVVIAVKDSFAPPRYVIREVRELRRLGIERVYAAILKDELPGEYILGESHPARGQRLVRAAHSRWEVHSPSDRSGSFVPPLGNTCNADS